jgi:hypothetical protein
MLSEKPWRTDKVVQLGIALVVCLCFGIVTAGALREFDVVGFRSDTDVGLIVVGTLSAHGAAWLLMLIFLSQHHLSWIDALGLRGPRVGRALLLAVVVAALVLPASLWLKTRSELILKALNWEPSVQTAVKMLEGANSIWLQIYLAVFTIVVAPVAEEFIFRGVLYPFVKRLGFPRLAWFGVSLVFALMHADAATLVPLFVLALALTWLYERTDNLLAPIAAHSLFNAVNVVFLFLDSAGQASAQT